jgi:ArsR family transcriptional regulator
MKQLLKVMKALGDGTRLKMLKLLQHRTLCVCELTSLLGLSQSAVSKNLKLLEDAELIACERQGPWSNYRLATEANPYAAAMVSQLAGWLDDAPVIRNLIARAQTVDRLALCKTKPADQARKGERQTGAPRPRKARRVVS